MMTHAINVVSCQLHLKHECIMKRNIDLGNVLIKCRGVVANFARKDSEKRSHIVFIDILKMHFKFRKMGLHRGQPY